MPRRRKSAFAASAAKTATDCSLPRLFVALELPNAILSQLQPLVQPNRLEYARWAPSANWHITLHFIGAAPLDTVHNALENVRASSFEAQLQSVGTFGPPKRQRVLWAGVPKSEPLLALHSSMGNALAKAGFKLDGRPYSPHVTIAKFGKLKEERSCAVKEFVEENVAFESSTFRVRGFTLFESVADKGRVAYRPHVSYPLGWGP